MWVPAAVTPEVRLGTRANSATVSSSTHRVGSPTACSILAILPSIMTNAFAAYAFSILITAGTMVLFSLFAGWEPHGELLHEEKTGWLRSSQLALRQLKPAPDLPDAAASWLPAVMAVIAVAIGCALSFLVFW